MKPFRLSRRALLKGAGGILGLPLLDVMLNSHGTALASGAAVPKRFMTFFFGNGVVPGRWTPTAVGPGYPLSPTLQPLVNVQPYVSCVSGYDLKTDGTRGHHAGSCAILSGTSYVSLPLNGGPFNSKFGGPSIDQLVAASIGNTTFRSVQVGISKYVSTEEGPTLATISHQSPDQPLTPERDPSALYKRLFAGFTPVPKNDPTAALRASVLDAVRSDANRLRTRLGTADRMRLDAHLQSVSEVQKSISALPPVIGGSCQLGPAPTEDNHDTDSERLTAVSNVMSDVLALAWACDLTRVVSYQFTGSVGGTVFSELGQQANEHENSHDTSAAGQDQVFAANVLVMKNFAYLLEKLKATPEGGGNLLDQACILFTSDTAWGAAHSINDYPILVAGKGGGALKGGVHVRGNGDNSSDVLLALMQAMGTGAASIGSGPGLSTTPCTGIMG